MVNTDVFIRFHFFYFFVKVMILGIIWMSKWGPKRGFERSFWCLGVTKVGFMKFRTMLEHDGPTKKAPREICTLAAGHRGRPGASLETPRGGQQEGQKGQQRYHTPEDP